MEGSEISSQRAFPTLEQTVIAVLTWRCDGILGCGLWQRSNWRWLYWLVEWGGDFVGVVLLQAEAPGLNIETRGPSRNFGVQFLEHYEASGYVSKNPQYIRVARSLPVKYFLLGTAYLDSSTWSSPMKPSSSTIDYAWISTAIIITMAKWTLHACTLFLFATTSASVGWLCWTFAAEHFDAAPVVLLFTTSLNSCGCLYGRWLLSAVVVYVLADALPRDITVLHSLHITLLLSSQILKNVQVGDRLSILHSTLYTAYIQNAHNAKKK